MAVFSTDQNRQFYYAGAFKAYTANSSTGDPTKILTNAGDITIGLDKDGFYHIYQKGKATFVKSDQIDPANIISVKASAPADMNRKLKKTTIKFDTAVNGGKPILDEDYIVRINFRQLYGISDADIYQKYGVVAVTPAMTSDNGTYIFWLTLAQSLIKNFKRTYTPLVSISLLSNTTETSVKDVKKVNGTWKIVKEDNSITNAATTYDGIVIKELPGTSDYRRGVASVLPVYFDVIPTTVMDGSVETEWATITNGYQTAVVKNGYDIADLEYFCMGERGDQYREKAWPNNIVTEYFVDPTKEYYTLDITYFYKGDTEDVLQSKKNILIASKDKTAILNIAKVFGTIAKSTANFGAISAE